MPRICRVLIVEDNEGIQALLGDLFSHEGFRFTIAADGPSMRAALEEGDIDVVVLDVVLPGAEDGFALAEEATARGLPVVLVTGSPHHFDRLEQSGHPYLMKPFYVADLLKLVERALRRARAKCRVKDRDFGRVQLVT
jgi:two-component system OmpR family response regulator